MSTTPTRITIFGPAAALLNVALACGYELHTDYVTEGCPTAREGCPCEEDGGCASGLECVQGTCQSKVGASTTTVASTGAGASTSAGTSASVSTSASTSTSTSTGAGSTSTSTGCEFICDTDQPGDEIACDTFTQDCREGQKCVIYDMDGDGAWDSTKCTDITGDGQHGDPCTAEGATGVDDCAKGIMCWNLNEDGEGTCVGLCMGSPENPSCAEPGTWCQGGRTLWLCLSGCDPLLQDCQGAEVCIGDPNNDGFVCVLDASGGMVPEGTPCEFANVCNPGLMCVNPDFYPGPDCQGSIGCCAPFCDTEDPGSCAGLSVAEAECVSYYDPEPAPPGFENVGVCGVPG